MKTNAELVAALHMILARLEGDREGAMPDGSHATLDAAGWEVIREHLAAGVRYATKCREAHRAFERGVP